MEHSRGLRWRRGALAHHTALQQPAGGGVSGEAQTQIRRPQVWQESESEGQASHARAQTRHVALGKIRQEGQEPQAGHRDRSFGSTEERRKGPQKEKVIEEETTCASVLRLCCSWRSWA